MSGLARALGRFGSVEALLAWAEETGTDVLSAFDITDEEWEPHRRASVATGWRRTGSPT